MTIRTVKCPSCGTGANVPVGMASVKCGSCGLVWNVNNPNSAEKPARSAKPEGQTSPRNSSSGSANKQQTVLVAAIAGVLALLAIVGIGVALFVSGGGNPEAPTVSTPEPAPAPAIQAATVQSTPDFREVNLPESTRQAIYLDYRKLVGSSTEKKVMIMKDSPTYKSLQNTLGKTVDREVTHFSLIHNITEDDVMQIVAEGDAKQWPGSRPPEPAEPAAN